MLRNLLLCTFVCLLSPFLTANNIGVTNPVIIDETGNASFARIQFDLSWENSWRVATAPDNWDAAWVFAKFRVNGGDWRHATLDPMPDPPTGPTIEVMDGKGAMVYRSSTGTGNVDFPGVELRWNFGADGFSGNGDLEIRVFALEMVYVPEGAFSLGTGPAQSGSTTNEVDEFYEGGGGKNPYLVSNDGPINLGDVAGSLYFDDTEDPNSSGERRFASRTGTIPQEYPEGFRGFYLMKYEMSQQQWVDFFNTLTEDQQSARDITVDSNAEDVPPWRNGIKWDGVGSPATTTRTNIPMGYLSQNDIYAYLDWAALRPMTELEYEKAARGPLTPVNNEFAWGNSSVEPGTYRLTATNAGNEAITNLNTSGTVGNAAVGDTDDGVRTFEGPLRCGIFAASLSPATRITSGASYYGVMELSGNQWEFCVVVTETVARAFTNLHGDGSLTPAGSADVVTWPASRDGVGFRGGRTDNEALFARVSDRTYTTLQLTQPDDRYRWLQSRGVRGL